MASSLDDRAREIARAKIDAAPDPRGDRVLAEELLRFQLGELVWVVPGMLPEGLAVLAGAPKMRKSFLVTSLGVSIACAGMALGAVPVEGGDVLHLALEDGQRRMQGRLQSMIGDANLPTGRLTIQFSHDVTVGVRGIEEWLQRHPTARIVIIDTWQRFRDIANEHAHANAYERDYEAARQIQRLALQYHVAILLVHHKKKGGGADWLEAISGSMGLPAACDTIWMLERKRGEDEAQLDVTGRDVEEESYGLRWQDEGATWCLLGRIDDTLTGETREVLHLLEEGVDEGLTPRQIADELGLRNGTARMRLSRLKARGLIQSEGKFPRMKYRLTDAGRYAIKAGLSVTPGGVTSHPNVTERHTPSHPSTVTLSEEQPEPEQQVSAERHTVTPISLGLRSRSTEHWVDLPRERSNGVTLEAEAELRAVLGPVAHERGVTLEAALAQIPPEEYADFVQDFRDNPAAAEWWVTHKAGGS